MVKKLTEGIHLPLFKHLEMGEPLDGDTSLEYRKYLFCQRTGWSPEQYDRAPASLVSRWMAFMRTEAKHMEMKHG